MAEPQESQETLLPQGQPFDPASPTLHWSGDSTDQRDVGADESCPIPQQIGRFQLTKVIGVGGFGTVHRAVDTQLDRVVALKVPRSGSLISEREVERFLREGRAAAQLRHPHIVPVYEAGRDGNDYYIASAFVDGESLRHRIRRGEKFTTRDAAQLVFKLAEALQFAHNKGIIHRDIKPENIMLTREGEPQIMDFGLARRETGEEDRLQTQEGTRMGTPAYMSPEQAEGKSHLADARSDVWSLGVVLYELLTGARPFEGNVAEILRAIVDVDPRPLRRVDRHVPGDLETICLKCLAKHPEQRYPSAQHLADDLERWLTHQPILARRTGLLLRTAKWIRRNPLGAAVLGCLIISASAVVIYQQTRPGYLDLHVSPANAQVTFNGEPVTLVDGRALIAHSPGRYGLEISATDHLAHQQQVTLVRGREDTSLVSVDLRSVFGHVEVDSMPSGANVIVTDAAGVDVAQGTTPFRSSTLASGTYTLSFQKDMYLPLELKADVPDGLRTSILPAQRLEIAVEGASSFESLSELLQFMGQRLDPAVEITITPEMTLKELGDEVSTRFQIPVFVSVHRTQELNIDQDSPLGGRVREMVLRGPSLREIDNDVLRPMDLAFLSESVQTGEQLTTVLMLTAAEEVDSRIVKVLHPVGDLVHGRWAVDGVQLASRITDEVDPIFWSRYGGPGTIEYLPIAYSLSVSHRWQSHIQIHDYLEDIREARAANERVFEATEDSTTNNNVVASTPTTEGLMTVILEPIIPAIGSVVRGAAPWSFPLTQRPAEKLGSEPVYGDSLSGYGALTLWGSADPTFVIAVDGERLFIDRNNDEVLGDDEVAQFPENMNGQRVATVDVETAYASGGLPYRVRLFQQTQVPGYLYCQSDTARGGELSIGSQSYQFAITDNNCDGRFDDLQNGLLMIDVDGDGTFGIEPEAGESHHLTDRLEINGVAIEIESVTADGLAVSFQISEAE